MVYGFARQSQGHVKIYSEPGRGTTVRLYLPRAKQGIATAGAVVPALPVALPGERILVVEDNADVRRMVVSQLGGLGYGVLEAADGPAALAIIEGGSGDAPFDLLFTDVVMPGGISGDDLARMALRRYPGLSVLLTSGFAGGTIGAGPPGEEPRHLLTKPYRQAELAAKVRAALDDVG
jgi:CheY-like chemotaxis protein